MEMIYTALIIVFAVTSFCLRIRARHTKCDHAVFGFLALFSTILFLAHFSITYFTGEGINDATIYHLRYGLGGAGLLDYIPLFVICGSVLLLVISVFVWSVIKTLRGKEKNAANTIFSYIFIIATFFVNPGSLDFFELTKDYAMNLSYMQKPIYDDFHLYYEDPYIDVYQDSRQKNIVFIYAESLERTYFDESIFPGLITELKKIEENSISFVDVSETQGTEWTVGGMTASMCGIPLSSSAGGKSMGGMDYFLPSVTCLGDLLKKTGYRLSYVGGANLKFAGKGKLLQTHGFDDVFGYSDFDRSSLGEGDYGGWGIRDDVLFGLNYKRFEELSQSGDKFAFFTLTLDTHQPDGSFSRTCEENSLQYGDGENSMLNAVRCSDHLISAFINKIITSPHSDDTIIILASDHLAMTNAATDLLEKGDRKNLFMIIDPHSPQFKKIHTKGSTIDIGPTLLSYMGFSGKIGLGRDLLDDSEQARNERMHINQNIGRWRHSISSFWDFPQIEKNLSFDVLNKIASIDERDFDLPILIEFDDALKTTLKFSSLSNRAPLFEYRKRVAGDKYFFLVDHCVNLEKIHKGIQGSEYCMLAGKGKKNVIITQLKNDDIRTFTIDDIQEILNMSREM